jgi:predicted dehydrogenase
MNRATTRPIGWGVLGTGAVAADFVRGLRHLPDARVQAVGSRTATRAEQFARDLAIPRAHQTYDAVLADPDVDVVYVATPNSRHKGDALSCLAAGKHVLCEKPFTPSAADAREVVSAARAAGLFCMEAMWMRFIPAVRRLKELLAAGEIGDPLMLTAELGFPAGDDGDARFLGPEEGGGAWLDLGVYLVSLAHLLFGPPARVVSQAKTNARGADLQSAAILWFGSGRQAVLSSSLCGELSGEARVVGTRGHVRVHSPVYRPHRLSLSRYPAPGPRTTPRKRGWVARAKGNELVRSIYFRLESLIAPFRGLKSNSVVVPFEGNGYNYEAAELMRCLRAGERESPLMPLDETVRVLETMDSIRAQWACGPAASGEATGGGE